MFSYVLWNRRYLIINTFIGNYDYLNHVLERERKYSATHFSSYLLTWTHTVDFTQIIPMAFFFTSSTAPMHQ